MSNTRPFLLSPSDATRYAAIRVSMLQTEPASFGSSPGDDRAGTPEQVAANLSKPQNEIFACIDSAGIDSSGDNSPNAPLIAAAGVIRVDRPKFKHRAHIWGVFVEPAFRGQGMGRAVTYAAINLAKTWQGVDYIDIGASSASPAAETLYLSLGFQPWGREPEATDVDGVRYDEIHMTMKL